MTNTPLKIAIIQSGLKSYEVERVLKFWPGKLSKIITGIIAPTKDEETTLAGVLDKKVCEIFPPEQVEAD
jgi:hypothetical protein